MHHFRFGLVVLLASFAVDATAATRAMNPWREHFSTRHLSLEGYEAQTFLPDGWSVDPDQHVFRPSDASLSGCRVRFDIYPDQVFIESLAAGIRDDKQSAEGGFHSELSRVGADEAVWVWYIDRAGNRIAKAYISMPGGRNDGLLAWKFVGPNTEAGMGCEILFRGIAGSSSFKPLESATTAPAN